MSADIVQFPGTEIGVEYVNGTDDPSAIHIDRVLDGEDARNLHIGLLIGRTEDDEFFFASTHADMGKLLILLKRAERLIVESID